MVKRQRPKDSITTSISRTKRHRTYWMDVDIGDARTIGTQTGTKRARTDAQEGATEVGRGLEVTIPKNVPHGYNNNFTVRLTYADNYRHDVTYGSSYQQLFRTNSIYDPDYTGTGHQPLMRDLWASQYDYYTVLACDYEITLYNGGTDTNTYTAVGTASQRINPVMVTLLPTTNDSDFNGGSYVFPQAEQKNARNEMIIPEGIQTFRGTLTPGDFIVDAKDADSDTTWTAVGSNPAVPRYLGYKLVHTMQSALTGQNKQFYAAVTVYVKLDFTVQFTQLNQSLRIAAS